MYIDPVDKTDASLASEFDLNNISQPLSAATGNA